jgi:phosphoglucosamine mutase
MLQKKYFRETDGIRGKANFPPLDVCTIVKVGMALAEYVKSKVPPNPNRDYKVIIGKDTRRSGYMIEQALTSGFLARGVDVMCIGPMPTPAISHLVQSYALDMGVMITASHNPHTDNGIKVFDTDGKKLTDEEELEIEEIMDNFDFAPSEKIGRAKRIEDVSGRYIEFVKSIVDNVSLEGMKIVVDCANGASYKTAPMVFEELGAKVYPVSVDPNGYNINENCGSLFPEKVKEVVLDEHADLGIALDGDGDRVIMVDEKGVVIDGDYITAIIAKEFKEKGILAKDTVVVSQYSNLALDEELKKYNIKVDKVINGDRAIAKLCDEKGYNFGGEFTGHFLFLDYTEAGDATLSALFVLSILKAKSKKLSELAYTFVKYPQKFTAIDVTKKTPLEEIPEIVEKTREWEEKFKGSGRVFLRYSGTENKIRIMVEAKDGTLVEPCMQEFTALVNKILV